MNGRFAGSLVFALLAGLGTVPWLLATTPWLPNSSALALFALASASAYGLLIAPTWAVGARAGLTIFAFSALPWLLASPISIRLVAPALALALVRSGWLYRSGLLRSAVLETMLAVAGLVLARWLVAPSALALGLAVWSYFLVQSAFFLVADEAAGPSRRGTPIDPFDAARRRALEVMGSSGGIRG